MGDLGILIIGVVDTFFAVFVVAPMMLQAASLFGVQKQFAKAMVQEGVVKQEDVDRIHPKKQIAGVVISLIMLAVLAFTCSTSSWRRISDKFKRIKTSPALCAGEVFIRFFRWCRHPAPRRRHTAPPPARQ